MITVAMGWWPPVGELVQRAVRSVLAQTHTDLHCVVIGDGAEPPLAIRDERLTVHTLSENHGAYFSLQLALLASPDRWFAPFGADDWADPEHLANLIAKRSDAVITGAVFLNSGRIHRGSYEVGLFSRARLLAVGGYNPSERIGQDTLLLRLVKQTGPVAVTSEPTYHRVRRPNALTTSKETGHRSDARRQMRARNRAVFAACQGLSVPAIAAYRTSLVPDAIRVALAGEVIALRGRLADRIAA